MQKYDMPKATSKAFADFSLKELKHLILGDSSSLERTDLKTIALELIERCEELKQCTDRF